MNELKERADKLGLIYADAAKELESFIEDAFKAGWRMDKIGDQLKLSGIPTGMLTAAFDFAYRAHYRIREGYELPVGMPTGKACSCIEGAMTDGQHHASHCPEASGVT